MSRTLADHLSVTIRWAEPGEAGYSGHPAAWWWPPGVPLPEVGDTLRINSGGSPLPGPVRVLAREWVCGDRIDWPRGPMVALELLAEVVR